MPVRNFYAYVLALFFVAATLVGCGGGSRPITISGSLPSTGTVGTAYSGSLTAAGGNSDFTWSVSGLPAGVTASNTTSATVTISGTPTTAGTAAVSYTVRDTKGRVQSGSTSVVISAPAVAITGTLAATGTVGTAYNGTLTASGGTGPYTWTVTGLPAGVTFSSGGTPTVTITGTPTAAGTSAVTATVTDSATPANTATYNVSIVVAAASSIAITGTLPPTGVVGTPYTGTLTAIGGTPPYTWSVTNLPDGTNVSDPSQPSITISGTPTTPNTYAFAAKVTDSLGANTSYYVHIVISGRTTACSATPSTRGNEASFNAPYAFVLSGYNDGGPTAYAGSVTPDGTGKITAGSIDMLANSEPSTLTIIPIGSAYSFGADGRGCLSLAYTVNPGALRAHANGSRALPPHGKGRRFVKRSVAQQVPSAGTLVFSISVSTPYQVGRIEEFDYPTSSLVAAGQMHQQTAEDFTLGALSANFVFGASGWAADNEAGFIRAAMAASISNNAGTLTSPAADINLDGNPSGPAALTGGTGTLTAPDATTGRGTGTYTITDNEVQVTFDFAYYVVNEGDFFAITTDEVLFGSYALTGRALAGSVTTPDLNGYYIFATTGIDDGNSANTVSIGTLQVPSAGSIANATFYTNDAGTFSGPTLYTTATYVLDPSTGRAPVTGLSSTPPVAYLTAGETDDGIAGFLVGTDADTSSGFIMAQTGSTPEFNAASLAGGYAYGSSEDVFGGRGSLVGQFDFTSGNFTYTADGVVPFSGPGPLVPDSTGSGSYSVAMDGSGVIGGSISIVTNGIVILGVDNATDQPFLSIWYTQTD